jgi:hypothetical protein
MTRGLLDIVLSSYLMVVECAVKDALDELVRLDGSPDLRSARIRGEIVTRYLKEAQMMLAEIRNDYPTDPAPARPPEEEPGG